MPGPAESSPPVATLDPELLEGFLEELVEAGWAPGNATRSEWIGPVPASLADFTDATEMRLTLRDAWPYRPPALLVPGIDSWHADHDHLCLWQEGDDTRQWATLAGIHQRIETWVSDANDRFIEHGAALDAHLHFAPIAFDFAAYIDIDELVSGAYQDGQHGFLHARFLNSSLLGIEPGQLRELPNQPRGLGGRWFYREHLEAPPRSADEFVTSLTDRQRARLQRDRSQNEHAVFVLVWRSAHGLVPLIVMHSRESGNDNLTAIAPTPKSVSDRLRRAGPDADVLQRANVVVFGVGAIGSHIAEGLARSGVGRLTLVDSDRIWPVGLVRHAAAPGTVGDFKPTAMKKTLAYAEWTEITDDPRNLWHPDDVADRISGHDLVIEATGQATFTELLARLCERAQLPLISVALYRGGRVARVRRQATDDTPLAERRGHFAYRAIPADPDQPNASVGVEAGCSAPVINAPPVAVVRAATMATHAAIDWIAERHEMPDEVIEVIDPLEAPFERRGLLTPKHRPDRIQIVEEVAAEIRRLASDALPNETGGVLLGYMSSNGPLITRCVHLPPTVPSPAGYTIEEGATSNALDAAREFEPSIGYVGEWHSHPSDQPASATDRQTMARLAAGEDAARPVMIVACPRVGRTHLLRSYSSTSDELAEVPLLVVGPVGHDSALTESSD